MNTRVRFCQSYILYQPVGGMNSSDHALKDPTCGFVSPPVPMAIEIGAQYLPETVVPSAMSNPNGKQISSTPRAAGSARGLRNAKLILAALLVATSWAWCPANAALPFLPGDAYRLEADPDFHPTPGQLTPLAGGTRKFHFEEGTFTDFPFSDSVTGAFLSVKGWSRRFPDFDYVLHATDAEGDGVFFLRQGNGNVVFQESSGTPSFFHQTALDPEHGLATVHSFKFPRGNKRVTLMNGPQGGFVVTETVGIVTRLALFDNSGTFVQEWATEDYFYVEGPIVKARLDGSFLVSGKVVPLLPQLLGSDPTDPLWGTKLFDDEDGFIRLYTVIERSLYELWRTRDIKHPRYDPFRKDGLLPWLFMIVHSVDTSIPGRVLSGQDVAATGAESGLTGIWIDDRLSLLRRLDFPELVENDPFRQISVTAGRGDEILFPAKMLDTVGGGHFTVLIRLDLATGDVLEAVRFKLTGETSITEMEYRQGRVFAQFGGAGANQLLRVDPLQLGGLEVARIANVAQPVSYNFPDDPTQSLQATWNEPGTTAHQVAAFSDSLADTFCLDFETVTPMVVETFAPDHGTLELISGTPADLLVEQTTPQWANLLQPNDRPITLNFPTINLTRTCEALRLVVERDGLERVRVRFPTITGYDYQLRSAEDPGNLNTPGAVIETVPGDGNEVIRSFPDTPSSRFFSVKALVVP